MSQEPSTKRRRGRPSNAHEHHVTAEIFRDLARRQDLDRTSAAPLWVQLRGLFEEAIASSEFNGQSRLPSESALCDIFKVSRPVVRAAISALASEGRLIKMPRKGVVIAPPRPETDFVTSNMSVFSDLTAHGHDVDERTIEFCRTPPDDNEKAVFGLADQDSVIRVVRVYSLDGKPLTYTHISLPGHRVPEMEKLDIKGESIFGLLKSRYGLVSQRAERWFIAATPGEEVVRAMGLESAHPMVWIESVAYDADDRPLEYYRAYYNSAVARIHVSTPHAAP